MDKTGEKKLIVVVDAGHGGYDPGCVAGGVEEEDVALAVAIKAAAELTRLGVTAVLTRSTDCHPSNSARAALANRIGADLYLAIHCNAAANLSARGFEVIHAAGAVRGTRLAEDLAAALGRQVQIPSRKIPVRADTELGRGKTFRLSVLRDTRAPAALVELGFLTNDLDRAQLIKPSFQASLARLLASALVDHAARYNLGGKA
jgi:N-acetylmuramoyl-L-alanine amidase